MKLPLLPVLVGLDWPSRTAATVFSVHDRAVNLEADGTNELLTITTDAESMTVTSIGFQVSAPFTGFSELGLERGASCSVSCDHIELGARATILVVEATRYGGRVDQLHTADPREVSTLIGALSTHLLEIAGTASGSLVPLVEMLGNPGRDWSRKIPAPSESDSFHTRVLALSWDALSGTHGDEPADVLDTLVGLGPGFTPSGDDFIVGFLAARQYTDRPVPEDASSRVRACLSRTTRPGATIVSQALRGCFPAYLVHFADGLAAAQAPSGSIRTLVAQVAAHGSTSGLDALTGFAFGLFPSGSAVQR